WKMHNPLAFFRLLFPGAEKFHLPLAVVLSLLILTGFVLMVRRRNDLPFQFGAVVFVTLLASPHALIYEWALLAVTGILWRAEFSLQPDRAFFRYALVWVVMFISTNLSELQEEYLPVTIQLSVLVLLGVYFQTVRQTLLDRLPLASEN
ncbi:MAG: hypothetical protein ACRCZF_22970, partial [Gemmataceae bacterium]